jgi:murein DD-endopeptidase MepM/ murein hydrolase activator NlpD
MEEDTLVRALRRSSENLARTSIPLSVLALVGIVALSALRTIAAEAPLQVSVSARAIQPGEVVLLQLSSTEPLERATANVLGRAIPLEPSKDPRTWQALVGLDLDTAPGEHLARIDAVSPRGTHLTTSYPLQVAPKQFETRRLRVAPNFVNPPAREMERIQKEAKRVQAAFEGVTPRRWEGPFRLPVGDSPVPNFGSRSIYNGQPRSPHTGVDFPSAAGTPVHASNTGRVVLAENLYFTGNTVIVDYGSGLYSLFAHLSRFDAKEGEEVGAGTVVGLVGATGRVTGPHLHWAMRVRGARIDPLSLVAASAHW